MKINPHIPRMTTSEKGSQVGKRSITPNPFIDPAKSVKPVESVEPKLVAIGMHRRIDDLGRVVIPKEIRKALKIEEGDLLEVYCTEEGAFLRKIDESEEV